MSEYNLDITPGAMCREAADMCDEMDAEAVIIVMIVRDASGVSLQYRTAGLPSKMEAIGLLETTKLGMLNHPS